MLQEKRRIIKTNLINKFLVMITHDIILMIKKIFVGVVLFMIPVAIMAGILWLIQFVFFK